MGVGISETQLGGARVTNVYVKNNDFLFNTQRALSSLSLREVNGRGRRPPKLGKGKLRTSVLKMVYQTLDLYKTGDTYDSRKKKKLNFFPYFDIGLYYRSFKPNPVLVTTCFS